MITLHSQGSKIRLTLLTLVGAQQGLRDPETKEIIGKNECRTIEDQSWISEKLFIVEKTQS